MSIRWRRPFHSTSNPSCTSPSRCIRAPTPSSSSRSTQTCSRTPARMRPRTCSPVWRSRITASIPALARSWPSSSPEGPAPTMATWVRRGAIIGRLSPRRAQRPPAPSRGAASPPPRPARPGRRSAPARLRAGARPRRPPPRTWSRSRIAGGSGPRTSIPSRWASSESCWKPSSTRPLATKAPTGTPGGGVTIRSRSSGAMPQRSNSRPSATPLGPVDVPMVRAASTARRTASSSPMSGRRAPARTATATGECARSTALPAARWPVAISFSIASRESATTSNASPACTRRATSTPPTDSSATAWPVRASKARVSSVSTGFVAIDEMADTGPPWPRTSPPSGRRGGRPGLWYQAP